MKRLLLAFLLLAAAAAAPAAFAQTVLSLSSGGPSDFVGQGQTVAYTPANAYFIVQGDRSRVRFSISGNDGQSWDLYLKAPVDDELRPREYFYAERESFATGRSPGMDFSGNGRGCNEVYGYFGIRQIAFDANGNLSMIEASVLQYCESTASAPLAVVVRWKAPYRSFTIDSTPGDYVGQNIHQKYFGDTSTFGIATGAIDYFHYHAEGMRDTWFMTFRPPFGQTYFKKGTYDTLTDRSGTLAGMNISTNGRGGGGFGRLNILNIVYSGGGAVTQMNADFWFYTDATRTKVVSKGSIRYAQ